MPVWHEKTKDLQKNGKLVLVGITQEQHPDRCLLFAKWKGLDWPILWDPFNMTGSFVVPRASLIDEHGVVRALRFNPETLDAEFLTKTFEAPEAQTEGPRGTKRSVVEAAAAAPDTPAASYYRALSSLLWREASPRWAQILSDLSAYADRHPKDSAAAWRLGVAYRMRHDSPQRRSGDFNAAIEYWMKGLALNPRQYIYRRRIQQYGPRLDKPYPFYPWIADARKALLARGETPPVLQAELSGAETAARGRPAAGDGEQAPDTKGAVKIEAGALRADSAVVWHTDPRRGQAARAHVSLRGAPGRSLSWDGEAGPITIWLTLPDGWTTESRLLTREVSASEAKSSKVAFDFEVAFPPGGTTQGTIKVLVLGYACFGDTGECQFIQHTFDVPVHPAR